jgi:uncharacterized Fe-S cluster-containing radical SAM superfamily protein
MAVQLRQAARMGAYLMTQRLRGIEKYPLIVELEPLFQCNLACEGCGKIQHPEHELRRRMPVDQAVGAVLECGAPMVSIAGGEPLIHPEIDEIVRQLVKRKKFVYLCTNALLLEKKLDLFKPSPYFSWAVHIDGLQERHDQSVSREGVFDKAVAAIKAAKAKGFRVTTNTTFFTHDTPETVRSVLDFLNDELDGVCVREGTGPGALPRRDADPRAVQGCVRRWQTQEVAFEPLAAVPGLPRGQGRLPVHAVGHSQLLAVRLAAPVLPDGRRLHEDLQRADRDHRLEQVRPR